MQNRVNAAMILAAGFGKRLQPVIGDLPKPLVKVGEKTALEINIQGLLQLDQLHKIIINIHWQADKIRDFIRTLDPAIQNKIILIEEKPTILETGGGIINAIHETGFNSLLVKNSDIVFFNNSNNNPYELLLDSWRQNDMEALLLLSKKRDSERGDFSIGDDSKIYRSSKQNDYTYSGCSIIGKDLFAGREISKFSLTEILFQATEDTYREYKFYGLVIPEDITFYDIGTPENLNIAKKLLDQYKKIF